MVLEELTAVVIVAAVKQGRSYATTGLLPKYLDEDQGLIQVETESPCTGRFIGLGGEELHGASGTHFSYLVKDEAYAGTYVIDWDGRDGGERELTSGVYLYRLRDGTREETRKLLLVR